MSGGDPRASRWRSYRTLAWAFYLVVAVGFSSLIIYSVFRSVLAMTPTVPAVGDAPFSESECQARARSLFGELESHRKALAEAEVVEHADQAFLHFRVEWLGRKAAVEARCELSARQNLRAVFSALDRVMDLYTTASVQFAGATGPDVDQLKRLLK
jgi:hypothetical protein